jgi:protein ImuB
MSKLYACIISENARADSEILSAIAYRFASGVEMLEDGVLLDVSGLEKLMGNANQLAKNILKELKEADVSGNVAIAENVDTALLLARRNDGLNHTARSPDKFRQLNLRDLEIDDDTLGVFGSLGIDRIEELLQVPEDELIARYGQDFRNVLDIIRQSGKRRLTPNIREENVGWRYELDFPVEDFAQLIFLVNRGLEEMLADIDARAKSTEQVDILFRLEDAERLDPEAEPRSKSYEIKASFPTLDRAFWLKLINLRISADPPQAGIVSIGMLAHFTPPRSSQSGLYAVSRPTPESLQLTVGKIKKLVGEENAGVPTLLEKRLEKAFTLDAGRLPEGKESTGEQKIAPPIIAFSYFDPPIPAEIFVRNRQLIYLRTPYFHGRVAAYSGVWRTGSGWWGNSWSRQEWHVEVENEGVYRLAKNGGDWSVIGEFD